jgi:ATP-dependent Clp protease ATP-binding subunit ClpB
LKQTVRPEFINRIDEIVMFTPLTKKTLRNCWFTTQKCDQNVAQQNITMDATPEASTI